MNLSLSREAGEGSVATVNADLIFDAAQLDLVRDAYGKGQVWNVERLTNFPLSRPDPKPLDTDSEEEVEWSHVDPNHGPPACEDDRGKVRRRPHLS